MAIIAREDRAPLDPALLYDIYCDESSQTRHRYMIMGGLVVRSARVAEANARIAELRLPELPREKKVGRGVQWQVCGISALGGRLLR